MPSPAARRLTQRHRRELALLAAAVTRRVVGVARQADTEDIEAWWEQVVEVLVTAVLQGWRVAAGLERRYQRQHAAVEGTAVVPVTVGPDEEQVATSLWVTGPVAFRRHMRSTGDPAGARAVMEETLRGSAERLTLDGSRTTAMATFAGSPAIVGWRRVGSSRPCAFCALLISRGAVYSKRSVRFRAHDHCSCTAEPLSRREPEPPEVMELRRVWEESATGRRGAAAIAAFRRAYSPQGAAATADG